MRLIRVQHGQEVFSGFLRGDQVVPASELNARHGYHLAETVLGMVQHGWVPEAGALEGLAAIPLAETCPMLPYDVPPKIWCIGLNYHSHAVDINAVQPEEPGSFMKPASCLFSPGGAIYLPPPTVSKDVDAEGELCLVMGGPAKNLGSLEEARKAIFGFTTALDLTALDVLAKNPRYLTRAKSIDTFFSFGPVIVTADEVDDIDGLEVITENNGAPYSRDFVRNMKHRPLELVRFHSQYFTWHPGDLLSTGCPKGARIKDGDQVQAHIPGVGKLTATVHGPK